MSQRLKVNRPEAATRAGRIARAYEAELPHRGVFAACGLIVLAAWAAYSNSFSGPFILDDQIAITGNPTIRQFATALSPPAAATTGGRPLLNLTFALNYALGGWSVRGYHAFNLLVHILAGLALFGILRRTFLQTSWKNRLGADAAPLALAVSLIWTVHPLQTESVTYISQRAESLMGLFYLLTLYAFIRSARSAAPARWQILSVAAGLLGVATKEIIVTAPVMVFLYDRTFVAGSFRDAWRERKRYYFGLAGIWLPLAYSLINVHQRHVGFDQGVTWWSYALTSCRSVALYLKLAFWPHPLVLYYGTDFIRHALAGLPYVLVVAALLAGVAVALRRRPAVGFAGAWFFVILAPTSSVVPVALQPMGEHRMYLPLAAVIGLTAVGLHAWLGRRSLIALAAAAAGLGWLTHQRNKDYRSELSIWSDTVAKMPGNAMARANLGTVLDEIPGRQSDAIAEYRAALQIDPGLAETHYDLGLALSRIPGHLPDAVAEYQAALRLDPHLAQAHYGLGNALAATGRWSDAIAAYRAALRLDPRYVDARVNLGCAWEKIPGHLPEAMAEYEAALRINPGSFEAHCDLGAALLQIPDRLSDAISEYEAALRINPGSAAVHYDLGNALAKVPGRLPEAIAEYEAALRIDPNLQMAHTNLGIILANIPGRLPDAVAHFEAALKLAPDSPEARNNLAVARRALAAAQGQPH